MPMVLSLQESQAAQRNLCSLSSSGALGTPHYKAKQREMAMQVKDIEIGAGAREAVMTGVRKLVAAREDA